MDKVTAVIGKIGLFLAEAKVELKKVTWPEPRQALASTGVVIVMIIIISIFLGLIDFGLAKLIKAVLR